MQYFISFLEGIVTFLSPCLLPMLPIYITYFAGGKEADAKKTLKNALGFVLGFTVVFMLLGALAGTLGGLLSRWKTVVDLITGGVVVIFGLHFIGLFELPIFKGFGGLGGNRELGFFSALLFGIVFSVGWTPCVGVFLGAALALASQQGHTLTGLLMLLCYSAGLGLPFLASALLIEQLKGAFSAVKKHYRTINLVCGILLVALGILMMTGLLGRLLTVLNNTGAPAPLTLI